VRARADRSPGPLVGSGRTADVFEHPGGRVLRRYHEARDTVREVAAMEYARANGFPAPAAEAASPTDVVMDRVTGPTMLADLMRRPWLIARHAALLADLHERLHSIVAPEWLPAPLGEGDALLHLDLHPDNVILTARGPVVIDWPNAARGPALADVAHSWLVMACSLPAHGGARRAVSLAGRRALWELFLRRYDRAALVPHLRPVARHRLADRTLPAGEHEAVARLLRKVEAEEN
jgi:Ser/Thr protein kinase RdoA (MazF antagonist)